MANTIPHNIALQNTTSQSTWIVPTKKARRHGADYVRQQQKGECDNAHDVYAYKVQR